MKKADSIIEEEEKKKQVYIKLLKILKQIH